MSSGIKLSEAELKELRMAHRRSKSKRESYRINTLVLLGQGWSYQAVSQALLLDESTIASYVKRYREGGIPGLIQDHYQAYTGRLTSKELELLDEHLQEVTYRRVMDIVDWVEKEFDEQYSVSGMTELLHRLNYSYKKPRKVPGKADTVAQEALMKSYRKIRDNMKAEDHLFFMDGVHPQHNPLVMYGWMKVGVEKPIKTNTRHLRLNIQGAIDIDGLQMVTQFCPRLNEDATLDMLESLRKKCPTGSLYLVLDNAGYYASERVKAFAKAWGIELLYLPPYSPNLNLIERVWLYFQKNVLYNQYYPTFKHFDLACRNFFKHIGKHKKALRSLLSENFESMTA